MMEGPSARSMARASSGDVQKNRTNLHAQITSLRKERGNASYTTLFESIEQTLSQLRLACMQAIFHDFEYAIEKKIEHTLWQAHTSVNGEYRKVIGRLGGQSQVVQKRKVERMYKDFLKTSQSFYCGYIQRLAGRFFIPELLQAAQGLNVQPTDMPSRETSPPSPLRKLVTNSCQTSLVHLGDLARYRCQISDKSTKSSFDTALAYYGLANAVDPDNGSAHHQMAVLHQLHALHFEIVYHFHRAIAVAKPHELGLGNLEREYRGLQNPAPAQARGSADAMVTWFVRLHGFYFQGETFTQQMELETEVLHRTERAYTATDNQETALLKMALINLASYDIATAKIKDSWTSNASRTCQFLLRWIVRSIALLLRLVKTELQNHSVAVLAPKASGAATESPLIFSESFSALLGFLRIYIAWIYTVRSDIVEYRDFLEPQISDVYRLLADSLTLLNTYASQCSGTIQSQYLLPEDIEAIGLRPLNDRKLPLFLWVGTTAEMQPPKKYKTRKLRKEAVGVAHSIHTETVWRIRDIVCCGILLAGSAHFPISITVVRYPDGQKVEGWVFTDEHPAESYISEIEMSHMLDRLEVNNPKSVSEQQPNQAQRPELPEPGPTSRSPVITGTFHPEKPHDQDITSLPGEDQSLGLVGEARPLGPVGELDINQDDEMVEMVNKLLGPSPDGTSKGVTSMSDTSYGMNSSTADDVFGQLGHASGQPSPVAKAIPNLPWGNFYNANWNENLSSGREPSDSAQNYGPRAPIGGHEHESLGGSMGTRHPVRGRVGIESNFDRPRMSSISRQTALQSRNSPEDDQPDSNESSRNAVLESLAQALYAQHGLSPANHNFAPGSGAAASRASSSRQSVNGVSFHDTGEVLNAPRMRYGSETSLQPRAPTGAYVAGNASNAVLAAQHMYHSSSGLPGLHETELPHMGNNPSHSLGPDRPTRRVGSLSNDISHGGASSNHGFGSVSRFDALSSPWIHGSPMPTSSISFSHPSSLFTGTPNAIAVPRTELSSPIRNSGLPVGMIPPAQMGFDSKRSAQARAPTHEGAGPKPS